MKTIEINRLGKMGISDVDIIEIVYKPVVNGRKQTFTQVFDLHSYTSKGLLLKALRSWKNSLEDSIPCNDDTVPKHNFTVNDNEGSVIYEVSSIEQATQLVKEFKQDDIELTDKERKYSIWKEVYNG